MLGGGRRFGTIGASVCALLLLALATASASAAPRCTIVGTSSADTLQGKAGADVICGRGGPDRIVGGRGVDLIVGGPGDDRLLGGPGKDALRGGRGKDSCRDSRATDFAGCERKELIGGRQVRFPRMVPFAPPSASEPPDTEAPLTLYLALQKRYVDTSAGDTSVGLSLEAWDQSGIGAISIRIDGPAGPWREFNLEGDATPLTAAHLSVDVPSSTPAGDYRFAAFTITDRKGNQRTVSAAELADGSSFGSELAVFHGPDKEPPKLADLSLSASEVDTSKGPATVELSIAATDALSGVNDVYASVELPNWEPSPLELLSHMGPETPPDSGTRHNGVWILPLSLVEHAMPGYYKVHAVFLNDLAGNKTRYTRAELEELGYPVEFLQAGEGDTTPPEILDLWFEPAQLQTSAGNRTIFFYMHVRDDLTGFGQFPNEGLSGMSTSFEPPGDWGEFSTTGRGPELVSGTELDGVWKQETVLEADAIPGVYELTYASATDRAGNDLLLKRADIQSRGWPDSFVNLP
jgi:hypothetical protein